MIFFFNFGSLIIKSQIFSGKKIFWDFNAWMDQQNSVNSNKFLSIHNDFGLKNHVINATLKLGQTLDVVIDCVEISIVRKVNVKSHITILGEMFVIFKVC